MEFNNEANKKIAVYTAIFGSYDELKAPRNLSLLQQADFYCFTDNPDIKSELYKIVYIEPKYKELVRNSRFIKIMGHPILNNYDYSIWMDAAFELTTDNLYELIGALPDNKIPLATFKHPYRNCIYQEAATCIEWNKDYFFVIFYQMLRYFIQKMPKQYGLYETGLLVKNHSSPYLKVLCKVWQEELDIGSKRDQLAFPYCLWKLNIKVGRIVGSGFANNFAIYHPHKVEFYQYKKSYKHKLLKYLDNNFTLGKMLALKGFKYFEANSSTNTQ